MPAEKDQMIAIGRITRAQGLRGEVNIEPLTDDPGRFSLLERVTVEKSDGLAQVMKIEKARVVKQRVILKLSDLTNRTEAEAWRGAEIKIPQHECLPLAAGSYYIFDLIGLQVVTAAGTVIGEITQVMDLPANDVYVVQSETREYLIPAISEVIKNIDLDAGLMTINPIEGLLD